MMVTVGVPGEVEPVTFARAKGLAVIAGPCVIESREQTLRHAEKLREISSRLELPLVFKSSYDKANRTSLENFRGVGIDEGLAILADVRKNFSLPVVTDIHSADEASFAGEVVDLLQIPAFLCRQTDLLVAAGRTGKPVLVKKGQFVAPEDLNFAAEKIRQSGNRQVLLCERGSCFGYRDLIVDFRSLPIMHRSGVPVVFDASHSVQVMGGAGGASGGNREFTPALARAAVAVGVDGIFIECHETPERAPSDRETMLPLSVVEPLLDDLKRLHEVSLRTRSLRQ